MLIPSLACPAGCHYCFGPHHGDGVTMSVQTLEAVVNWQQTWDTDPLDITFHGGEPLVPGLSFYQVALPLLRDGLPLRRVRFGMQSNLWLLTGALCELFAEHEVSLGTSLDGPEEINDAQRGPGYFSRTMAGIRLARCHGLSPGCISTFTAQSAGRADEVFDFFLREGLAFSIHAALAPLGRRDGEFALAPGEHGQLLVRMLDQYLENPARIRINTLDAMSRSVSARRGGVCTFGDCLGHYLAVDPRGWIYPCQRFAGMETFRLGNVHDCPTREDLEGTIAWRILEERQERMAQSCGGCPHFEYCRGGCPYGVLTEDNDNPEGDLRDPHCPAYRKIFDRITEVALSEVFSEENLAAVAAEGTTQSQYGLLRRGRLTEIMRGGPHPQDSARRARQAVAAVALATCDTPESALDRLNRAGVITDPPAALGSLWSLRRRLDTQSRQDLVNAYIHVTDACNLVCRHCYATSRAPADAVSMDVEDVARLIQQAGEAGFKKTVITGGEPLVHPRRDALLEALASLRQQNGSMRIILRTNLAYPLAPALTERLLAGADEIVVSVDGDRESHDEQRGAGTYAPTVANLRLLLRARQTGGGSGPGCLPPAGITVAATLTPVQMEGPAGDGVRNLGEELDLPVRFKPVLPLGRGVELGVEPAFHSSLDDGDSQLHALQPAATCGLGMNLYVGPDGASYPCYAIMTSRHHLGNALTDGLPAILARNDAYRRVTVDSNRRCRTCTLRYLCGGFCRAWSGSDDPDGSPRECADLHRRAEHLLRRALDVLGIDRERWQAAGLP